MSDLKNFIDYELDFFDKT